MIRGSLNLSEKVANGDTGVILDACARMLATLLKLQITIAGGNTINNFALHKCLVIDRGFRSTKGTLDRFAPAESATPLAAPDGFTLDRDFIVAGGQHAKQ